MKDFAARLIAWQQAHGRRGLPWQVSDPYAVWLSEVMLQQTQVETVIPYYLRFLARFPDPPSLAAAGEDELLACWSGLGYYARARNLHAAARRIVSDNGGAFPRDFDTILALPGIGRSTAAAIAVFAFGERRAILDGNVKRVFCRLFGIGGWPGQKAVESRLWALAETLLPVPFPDPLPASAAPTAANPLAAYTQGLMDLGATVCRRSKPDCGRCPFGDDCEANRHGRQAKLPFPRPRKPLPKRDTAMLVLLHGSDILLEKRPSSGIWGGLWSLPECSPGTDPVRHASLLGYTATLQGQPGVLDHAFSHFRLRIHAHVLTVAELPPRFAAPGQVWLPRADALAAALPAPVRRLLRGLDQAV